MATKEPLRYAHPFFGDTPPPAGVANPFGDATLSAWVVQQLQPIPAPGDPNSVYNLSKLIGPAAVDQIQAAGSINFHALGDTGTQQVHTYQDDVAQLMAADYTVGDDAHNPAFCLHLGDVIYGPNKDVEYLDEFYRPYMKYPGKVVAIPGNHDGEVLPPTDPDTLKAFLENFCTATQSPSPIAAGVGIARLTVDQPGVYYLLRAPFVDIVCMYSNTLEGPGSIIGAGGDQKQRTWLAETLNMIAAERQSGTRRALVFATHHPPYSSGGHGGSQTMLTDIDNACPAGIHPDAHLSGHAHNYQRYIRTVNGAAVPYVVAGNGGHNATPLDPVSPLPPGDVTYDFAYPDKGQATSGYGYLKLTASTKTLSIEFFALGETQQPFDSVQVPLN